ALVYNYDGSVYASDESRMLAEMGDQTFRLGTVRDSYETLIGSDALLDPIEASLLAASPCARPALLSRIAVLIRFITTPCRAISWGTKRGPAFVRETCPFSAA